jgi:hypothetical protein
VTVPSNQWDIPRKVWAILASWGLAVLVIASLLSYWIWSNERSQDTQNARAQREQDRAMCVMLDLFTTGPAPVAGPAGDRGRAVLKAMNDYRGVIHCDDLAPSLPVGD